MILRHRDRELLRFEWVRDARVRILSVNDAERRFLPLEFGEERLSGGCDKGVKVDVSADGTELVIPVPANAEQGFMVLGSGEVTK